MAEAVKITPPPGETMTGLLVVAGNDSGVVELSSHGQHECVQIRDQWCDQPRLQMILLDPAITGTTPPGRIPWWQEQLP